MKSLIKKRRNDPLGNADAADVDLTPIMCLFIILVPLLLSTAVFEKLASSPISSSS